MAAWFRLMILMDILWELDSLTENLKLQLEC